MNIRGGNAIHNKIANDETKKTKQKGQKGRSNQLHSQRNACLVERYYFIARNNPKLKYEAIIEHIANEFFLSVHSIPDILKDNITNLQKLKQENHERGYFKRRWPHLNWNLNLTEPSKA